MKARSLLASATLAVAPVLMAAPVAPEVADAVRARIEGINPQINVTKVETSPIDGVLEVELDSGETLFTSRDGEYFLLGQLYQVRGQGFVNLSEQRKKGFRAEKLASLNKEDMVIYPAKGEAKAVVTVFTDVDCSYCRRLHSQMADYNARGIEIRYLAYPRAGIGSDSYRKMVSVWCADDRNAAMDLAKQGGVPPEKSCDNPVADHYNLGQQFGVTGTPALVFEDGSLMPGYVPPDRLAAVLELN